MAEKVRAFGKLPQILTFPLKGEGWFGKIAIAALVMLAGGVIPILPGLILLGYFYEMVRQIVIDHKDPSLPEWDNWGEYITNGFKWWASTLIVSLPVVLIILATSVFYFVIPIFFVEGGMDEGFIMSFLVLLFVVQFVMIFVSTIFMVLMGLFAPVYMTHMVADGSFKAMFQIKQWWKIFVKGFWEFLISFMLVYGLSMLLYYVFFTLLYSVVCCCLAPFVIGLGTVYLMAVYFALIACAYRDGRDKSPVEKQALPAGDKPAEAPAAISSPKPAEEAPAISAPAVEVEAAPAPETAEEFELPSPDGEAVEAAAELDATQVSGVNQEVAAAMGFANATIKMDDLKKINGIGPKTASVLKQNGIMNFEQLAAIDVAHLKDILTANGLEIVAAACEDWPQQAKDLL